MFTTVKRREQHECAVFRAWCSIKNRVPGLRHLLLFAPMEGERDLVAIAHHFIINMLKKCNGKKTTSAASPAGS